MTRGMRCLTVWLAVSAALATTSVAGHRELVAALTTPWAGLPFDALLVRGTAVVGAAAGAWLWLVTSLTAWEAARGAARVPGAGGVRRLVLVACGVALVGGATTVPASAASGHEDHGTAGPSVQARLLGGLPLPDRARIPVTQASERAAGEPVAVRRATPAARPTGATVEVVAGDSLWSIAAATLPPDAGPELVDRRWRAIYAANRAVIGVDPDHIRPGLRLDLPS